MDKDILPAILARDEAEALCVIEPLDLAGDRNGGRRIRSDAARTRGVAVGALRALDNPGRIDLENAGDLRSLGSGPDLNPQLGAGGNRLVAGSVESVGVQEGVALAVCKLDESRSPCRP